MTNKIGQWITAAMTPQANNRQDYLRRVVWLAGKGQRAWRRTRFVVKAEHFLVANHGLDPQGDGFTSATMEDNVAMTNLMIKAYDIQGEPFFTNVFSHNKTFNPLEGALTWGKWECGRALMAGLGPKLPDLLNRSRREVSASLLIYQRVVPEDIQRRLVEALTVERAREILPFALEVNRRLAKTILAEFGEQQGLWDALSVFDKNLDELNQLRSELWQDDLATSIAAAATQDLAQKQRRRPRL